MRVSIAKARSGFSALLKHTRKESVIVTHRGEPDMVILPFEEYERLQRLRAYANMMSLSRAAADIGTGPRSRSVSLRRSLPCSGEGMGTKLVMGDRRLYNAVKDRLPWVRWIKDCAPR